MTAEFEGEQNLGSSESVNPDIYNPLGDVELSSVNEHVCSNIYGSDLRSKVIIDIEETMVDERIPEDTQTRIWNREDETELQVIGDEDQSTENKKKGANMKWTQKVGQ